VVPWLVVQSFPGDGQPLSDADLVDVTGAAYRRLALRGSGSLLVRPDGHVAVRAVGLDLADVRASPDRWLSSSPGS